MSNEEEEFNNEEEEFGGDEVVIDGDDGEIVFDEPQESQIDDTQIDEERQKREEDERVKEELVKRFNPTTGAARRLINDLKIMMDSNPKELGFSCQPKNEDIFTWEVRLFGFEKGTPMMKDIEKYQKQTGRDYVELSVTFPPDYPINPPFVRVVRPRFVPRTGRVTAGGSLCTDILTSESWNPMYGIDSLMVNILSEILNGNPRIDFTRNDPYSLEEARAAYQRVASDHGWRVPKWMPNK
ncbi:Ubiquitin-conjugating enzyme family protein [Histomonas meleagridis]|uniref:Ubiquitin-conjugating enzyme family protein n=1 Tax=Histomonas meleagridis TaxID=135588 RepID=UPI00355969AB|nr:Ubiquitin-conjugating enzyme family protein [Histomonas meleagridis]KAH0800053.1 Ubiquitin-conjugating enzyme family protein [Histomonas meleagridis]